MWAEHARLSDVSCTLLHILRECGGHAPQAEGAARSRRWWPAAAISTSNSLALFQRRCFGSAARLIVPGIHRSDSGALQRVHQIGKHPVSATTRRTSAGFAWQLLINSLSSTTTHAGESWTIGLTQATKTVQRQGRTLRLSGLGCYYGQHFVCKGPEVRVEQRLLQGLDTSKGSQRETALASSQVTVTAAELLYRSTQAAVN